MSQGEFAKRMVFSQKLGSNLINGKVSLTPEPVLKDEQRMLESCSLFDFLVK